MQFHLPPHAQFAYERVVGVGLGKELQRLTVLPIITATRSCWGLPTEDERPVWKFTSRSALPLYTVVRDRQAVEAIRKWIAVELAGSH